MLGTCKNCNHPRAKHPDKKKCKAMGCSCKEFKAKGLLEA